MTDAIVLIGMPGAGKSTVGVALAQLLRWGFVDTDDLIGASVGCDIASYIRSHGVDAAREQERTVVQRLAATGGDRVIAVGGGTVVDASNRAALQPLGPLVWLRAQRSTLLQRLRDDPGDRPLLTDDVETSLVRLIDERSAIYAEIASHTIDVDGLDPNEVAVEIVKALAS